MALSLAVFIATMRALCSEALASRTMLVDLAVDVERQQRLRARSSASGSKSILAVVGLGLAAAGIRVRDRRRPAARLCSGSSGQIGRRLDERVAEMRVDHLDGVDVALEELLHHELGDDLDLGERRRGR